MSKEVKEILRIRYKMFILGLAGKNGNVAKTCRDFDVTKSSFYKWRKAYDLGGKDGLKRKKPIAYNHPNKISEEVIEKILELRKDYNLGPERIKWYLERYHGIKVSESSVSRTLVRNGVSRLSKKASKRTVHTKRYAKDTPGHQVQVDVKFVSLNDSLGNPIRRFQYTAIDDATRIRALKIFKQHEQKNAKEFIDHITEKFPFRIHTIRTDRGHEFQAQFHWHVEDKGMRHVYIKPRSPQLNGKVERSHRTDQEEFYQLLTYTDDVDLNKKLKNWEEFYNFNRPHGAFEGKTPYEKLNTILKSI